MKILVLGGNRFSGKALVNKLVDEKKEVHVFNRSGTAPMGVRVIKGNRNNIADLKKIDFDSYDCVVDMCLYKLDQFNLIRDLLPVNTNYVFVSSGVVDYPKAFGEYAREKIEVESALINSHLNFKILRPSYIIGRGDHNDRLGYYINMLKNGMPIEVDGRGDCPINLVFVQDVAECLYKLSIDHNMTRSIYYATSDNSITVNDLISMVKERLGIVDHIISNSPEAPFVNQPFEFDNSRIKNDYHVVFTDLPAGIGDYMEIVNEY